MFLGRSAASPRQAFNPLIVHVADAAAAAEIAALTPAAEALAARFWPGPLTLVLPRRPLQGGRGSMLGTVLGTLTIAVIGNGLILMHISPFFTQIVTGAVSTCSGPSPRAAIVAPIGLHQATDPVLTL